ncbi:hypothetical protein LEP48_09870 [Isoptericola sp. NEAU-Y5]|uniref:AMIN-like domain-containing protein n=1 Tax=Isoptericola luteus TaxID=2879484 RepID=A0ABS7ZF52_9MICO|nr:hypothetical protein [Isoptericola sp. NEAU-Y5]MCA5893654.1 hypothetical protein [Isoptericola sp. NEAU-Y5]
MSRSLTRARTGVVVGATAVLLLAACADDADAPGTDGTTSTTTEASATPSPATSPADDSTDDSADDDTALDDTSGDEPTQDAPFPANAEKDTGDASQDAALVVTGVRVGTHQGFDRVVFDLEGTGTPGWSVEYVDSATDDGSGEPVDVDGDKILQVRLSGMAVPTEGDVTEYDGATLDPDGTDAVEEVVYRFWFEGYTTAFVGVDDGEAGEPLPFRVFALEDPARVVVDVQHGPDDD